MVLAVDASRNSVLFNVIFVGDVPLHRVKFNANQEFQYVQNFKVLQSIFLKHQIANVK